MIRIEDVLLQKAQSKAVVALAQVVASLCPPNIVAEILDNLVCCCSETDLTDEQARLGDEFFLKLIAYAPEAVRIVHERNSKPVVVPPTEAIEETEDVFGCGL